MDKKINNLIGMIPVGGTGGAMKPLTDHLPKCLLYVGHQTLLEHAISNILTLKPDVIYFISNSNKMWPVVQSELIKLRHSINVSTRFEFIVIRNYSYNTGSILQFIPEIQGRSHRLITFFPDVYLTSTQTITNIYAKHMGLLLSVKNYIGTILSSTFKPIHEGIIFTDSDGFIVRFEEKPNLLEDVKYNTAISVLEPSIIDFMTQNTDGLFSNVIPTAIQHGKILSNYADDENDAWFHLRTAADLHDLHSRLIDRLNNSTEIAVDSIPNFNITHIE